MKRRTPRSTRTYTLFPHTTLFRSLDLLPEAQDGRPLRHALEVRHESFRDPAVVDLARERNMAIVFADSDEFPCIDEQTADFAYARLQRSREDVETGYDDKALDHWADRARGWAKSGPDGYPFFLAGGKGRKPARAQALLTKLGECPQPASGHL